MLLKQCVYLSFAATVFLYVNGNPVTTNETGECILPIGKWVILGGHELKPGSSVPNNTVITFSCDEPYTLSGGYNAITCLGKEWDLPPPECEISEVRNKRRVEIRGNVIGIGGRGGEATGHKGEDGQTGAGSGGDGIYIDHSDLIIGGEVIGKADRGGDSRGGENGLSGGGKGGVGVRIIETKSRSKRNLDEQIQHVQEDKEKVNKVKRALLVSRNEDGEIVIISKKGSNQARREGDGIRIDNGRVSGNGLIVGVAGGKSEHGIVIEEGGKRTPVAGQGGIGVITVGRGSGGDGVVIESGGKRTVIGPEGEGVDGIVISSSGDGKRKKGSSNRYGNEESDGRNIGIIGESGGSGVVIESGGRRTVIGAGEGGSGGIGIIRGGIRIGQGRGASSQGNTFSTDGKDWNGRGSRPEGAFRTQGRGVQDEYLTGVGEGGSNFDLRGGTGADGIVLGRRRRDSSGSTARSKRAIFGGKEINPALEGNKEDGETGPKESRIVERSPDEDNLKRSDPFYSEYYPQNRTASHFQSGTLMRIKRAKPKRKWKEVSVGGEGGVISRIGNRINVLGGDEGGVHVIYADEEEKPEKPEKPVSNNRETVRSIPLNNDFRCPALSNDDMVTVTCYNDRGRTVSCETATAGTRVEYKCATFYEPPTMTYETGFCYDGQWTVPKPTCVPVCGKPRLDATPNIVGGNPSVKGDYPWVAAIYADLENICGGSMLTQKVILTAAHCVTNNFGDALSPFTFKVGVGKYYNGYRDANDTDAQYSDVISVIVHPSYKGANQRFGSDIALLATKDTLSLSRVVQPICYLGVDKFQLVNQMRGWVTGWGFTTPSGSSAKELKQLIVPYKNRAACNTEFPKDWLDAYLTYDKFCAGFVNKSVSVCRGDSGGGLVFKNTNGRYYVQGIVSIGMTSQFSCNIQYSALYTRVSSHLAWIKEVIALFG